MGNRALRRPILDSTVKHATQATDGNSQSYTGKEGFAAFRWPSFLTVDLEEVCAVKVIRLLLWDGLGQKGGQLDKRLYEYRLLCSEDEKRWIVVHDTGVEGTIGWQEFRFQSPIRLRYVRIHGLHNTANDFFHVVEVEAHDEEPQPLTRPATMSRVVDFGSAPVELGDGLPITYELQGIITSLERLINDNSIVNPEPVRAIASRLQLQVADVARVERNVDSIRRSVIAPIAADLVRGRVAGKFSIAGFYVGIIGAVLAIISILVSLVFGRCG
jgi:hypothetical protein